MGSWGTAYRSLQRAQGLASSSFAGLVCSGPVFLRALHSTVVRDAEQRIIDATYGSSVVAGLVTLRTNKTVVLAEVFSGSFNGWSQAASVLRDLGYDVKVRWLLDHDPACSEAARLIH